MKIQCKVYSRFNLHQIEDIIVAMSTKDEQAKLREMIKQGKEITNI